MEYVSTRNSTKRETFSDILLSGLAPDGGLYVPDQWPEMDMNWLSRISGLSYGSLASQLIQPFIGKDIPDGDIQEIIENTYSAEKGAFDHAAICPMRQIGPNVWLMELFHGPTLSFKDVAMQLLGALFDYTLKKEGKKITVLAATSGDTGSAAIHGCMKRENIDIVVLHPHEKISEVQRKQMTGVSARNIHNIAVKGNFDDCQSMVKTLFEDADFKKDMNLTAVNSINWARIVAQMVYYFAASLSLGGPRRPVSFVVPTGNFGNAFSAYVAKKMGLPIDRIIIANNTNDTLSRFFYTGSMKPGHVSSSLSPSMDIQIPSNFERYLFELLKRDDNRLKEIMDNLKNKRAFNLSEDLMPKAQSDFRAYSASDNDTLEMIQMCFETTGIIVDPHTAVGLQAAQALHEDPETPLVVLSCAHPAKFPQTVHKALGIEPPVPRRLVSTLKATEKFEVIDNDIGQLRSYLKKM